jgi:hypothetical protein
MKTAIPKFIIAAAFAVYPFCAYAQRASEDTSVEPLEAPQSAASPGQATIAPSLALKQPDARLRSPDQINATSLWRAPQAALPLFRPTMGTAAYLAAKAAAERSPKVSRPEISQPLAPPLLKLSIEGVNQITAGGSFPPDTEGATGINHFVEVTNSHVDIYLKSNGLRVKSISLASFMGYFTRGLFDPRAVYDSTWNRWVITADAFPESATVQRYFIAVSTSPDPTGSFFIYNVNTTGFAGTNNFYDFPMVGMDQDAVLFTANIFSPSAYLGPRLFAVAKARLYNGLGFSVPVFNPGSSFGTLAPSIVLDQDAHTYIASARTSGNTLQLFTLLNSSKAFGATLSAAANVPVTAYTVPSPGLQPVGGSANRLDSGDSRFVNAGTQNSGFVWQAHSIEFGGAAVRWYKINAVNNTIAMSSTLFQAINSSDFNASIAANAFGDLYLTWTSSSPSVNPQVIFDGERAGNFPPTRGTVLFTSSAALTGNFDPNFGLQRWGDYSAVTVDPTNALRAGLVNEKVNSPSVWGSRISLIGF